MDCIGTKALIRQENVSVKQPNKCSINLFSTWKTILFFSFASLLTAYLLYDNGYDVWMGNCRGTRPSRGHVRLDPNGSSSKEYWSFSLHELGVYDLPASIDYILEKTNASQLNYVGYSQGTALFFIMTSVRPEYNEKIASMIAMAPAVFVKHSQHTFLNILSKYNALIKKVLDYYMIYSIDYGNRALRWLAEFACKQIGNKSPFPCQFLLFFLDSNQINCVCMVCGCVSLWSLECNRSEMLLRFPFQ